MYLESILKLKNEDVFRDGIADLYHEQWAMGTFLVTGIFPRRPKLLRTKEITENIPALFELIKANKKTRWFRGMAGYFAIPIYISDNFDSRVIEWVMARPRHRWAMWHEPILYNRRTNEAVMNCTWGYTGAAFHHFLFQITRKAVDKIAASEGHTSRPKIKR